MFFTFKYDDLKLKIHANLHKLALYNATNLTSKFITETFLMLVINLSMQKIRLFQLKMIKKDITDHLKYN